MNSKNPDRYRLFKSREGSVRRKRDDDGGGEKDQGAEYKRKEGDDDNDSDDDNGHGQTAVPITSSPTVTFEYMPTSTLLGVSESATDVLIVVDPEILVSVSVSAATTTTSSSLLMTTQSVESISTTISVSSQPRQASSKPYAYASATSASPTSVEFGSPTTLFAFENGTPTPMVSFNDVDNNYGDDVWPEDDHSNHQSAPGSLSPDAEHALISVGSIGGFILVCFVFWMAWRMVKKSKRKAGGIYGNQSTLPYFGRSQRRWQTLEETPNEMLGSNPRYEKATLVGQASGSYSINGSRSQTQFTERQGPMVLPQLQTNLSSNNISPYSTPTSVNMQNQQRASPSSQMSQQSTGLSQLQTSFSPSNNVNPLTNTTPSPGNAANTYATISPSSTVQFGGTMQTGATMATDRSLMADPFYNQPDVARQPTNAYDPSRRHVYRASELSSLSSGFGDGDIIVPPPATLQQSSTSGVPRFDYQQVPSTSRKDSIASVSEVGDNNRDTVYTATSEDMPMRYRTVSSWVNQQTGRVHRAAQKEDEEDVPPVPMMPPEERYTMMMDDEEPRRPDTVPVPALPPGASYMPDPNAELKEMNP